MKTYWSWGYNIKIGFYYIDPGHQLLIDQGWPNHRDLQDLSVKILAWLLLRNPALIKLAAFWDIEKEKRMHLVANCLAPPWKWPHFITCSVSATYSAHISNCSLRGSLHKHLPWITHHASVTLGSNLFLDILTLSKGSTVLCWGGQFPSGKLKRCSFHWKHWTFKNGGLFLFYIQATT